MKKPGRNDPCTCGSGKKFKKCCESTMLGGRFRATRIEPTSAPQISTASRLTGFFQNRVAEVIQPSAAAKPINITTPSVSSTNGKS